MKRTNIIYWIFTGLYLAFMLLSGIQEISQTTDSKAVLNHFGYPLNFNPFLGALKILGVIAILVPGYPRLKEWAYAGFFFDLLGATYAQIATDGMIPQIGFMAIFFIVWGVSYIYFHKRLSGAGNISAKSVPA